MIPAPDSPEMRQLGQVLELTRYPIKSMAGIAMQSATLGWHGFNGDRRYAFRRLGCDSDFPWLSATRFPGLLLYHPFSLDETGTESLPTHVRTPAGKELELRSAEFRSEITQSCGLDVELMQLKHGIFDEAPVSVISSATIASIGRIAGLDLDRRRFRANIVVEPHNADAFLEDGWVGGTLVFGERETGAAVRVTMRDVRCMMINLDPDTARQEGRVMKTVVQLNANTAGVYGTVLQPGTIHVGQAVSLVPNVSY